MKVKSGIIPIIVFIIICLFFLFGLEKNPQELPSVLINHKFPKFELTDLNGTRVDNKVFKNNIVILNFWASWCYACLKEHDELFKFTNNKNILLIGVDYKDNINDAKKWLNDLRNPYKLVIFDVNGNLGLDLGVYGVPETFIIDKNGVIRMRIAGPITDEIIDKKINPLLQML